MKKAFVCNDRFNKDESLKQMISELDSGKILSVGTDCLGHGDNNATQESIKRKLEEHYGTRLEIVSKEGVYSYSYTYRLKDSEK
jgi:hypothetical protein